MRRGKKLDKIEAAVTLRSGLSLEGVIGSKTARRERSVWGETGDCGSGVLFFCSTARVFFRRVRWVCELMVSQNSYFSEPKIRMK